MAHELNYNELIMLDALAYYKELSDDYNPEEINDQINYRQLIEFVDNALIHIQDEEEYKTCFNDALSDEKNGMVEILNLVKQNPRLTRLEIVYPVIPNDVNTSSVCLVDPVTKNVYVIYGGNYIDAKNAKYSTWVENFLGAVETTTGEHENALRFYEESIAAARAYLDEDGDLDITVSGHSAAGNMAQYVTIAYKADDVNKKNDIDRCISVDGQGFSAKFLNDSEYSSLIKDKAKLITSIVPDKSIVGSLMYTVPGITEKVIEAEEPPVPVLGYHMPSVLLSDKGELNNETDKSLVSKIIHAVSCSIVDNLTEPKLVDERHIMRRLGEFAEEIFSEPDDLNKIEKCAFYIKASLKLLSDNQVRIQLKEEIVQSFNDLFIEMCVKACKDALPSKLEPLAYALGMLMFQISEQIEDYRDVAKAMESYISLNTLIPSKYTDKVIEFVVDKSADLISLGKDAFKEVKSSKNQITGKIKGAISGLFSRFNNESDDNSENDYSTSIIDGDNDDNFIIAEGSIAHTILGFSGNDVIWGDTENDEIYGGKGKDIIIGGNGNDVIHGDADSVSIILVENNSDTSLYDDEIHGGDGDDKIYGEFGNDHLYGNSGDDEIYGGCGDDSIYGGENNDKLYGDSGNDIIHGDSGEDIIDGGPGNDWIYGGEDNDTIETGGGDDHVWGEGGNDQITAAGGEHNYLYGGKGFDTISGSVGIDHIYGEDDDDTIDGSFGNDKLFGGNENDTLDGGYGDDELYGGNGNDTYIITKNRQKNTILDTYGHNYLDFRNVSLEEVEFAFSEETEDTLDITIKDTNDIFTIKKFSESAEKFSLVFNIESDSHTYMYYKFIENDGKVGVEYVGTIGSIGTIGTERVNDTLWGKVQGNSKNNNARKYEDAESELPPRDPLVIDFSEAGSSSDEGLVNADGGVYFDLDNNGFAEKTAWINADKGFLAYDRNGNGVIDNGSELFGDSFIMSDGRKSEHGFEALADFNSNNDDVIDKDDAMFKDLRVWKDTEKNGRTDAGELKTLEELGIESISLTTTNKNQITESGTIITDSAVVTRKGKKPTEIAEHWFEAHSYDTQELNIEGDGVSLTSFGIMPSLTNALVADESGELALLVEDFKKSDDFAVKRIITKKILYFITGANEIASDSRGGTVDARDLHVIEAIMGIDSYIGADGSSIPNSNAAPILKELYVQFENLYLSLLDNELDGTGYIEYLEEVIDENNNIVIDPEYIDITIENAAMLGKNVENIVFSIGSYLKTYDNACGTNCFGAFKERYPEYADVLDTVINADSVLGTANDDVIDGTKSSEIFWGDSGNDTINAGGGNDFIYGGAGNDVLNGGSGNDTYFFGKDHGNDVVNDRAGETKLVFTDGASAEDYDTGISVSEKQIGFTLTNKQTGDTIFLPDFISMPTDYKMIFDDSTSTIGGGDTQETVNGTAGNDYLEAGDGFNIFYGGDGEDTIAGGANIDIMYGGENDDTLLGRNGTNIVYGEGGNDKIYDGDDSSYLSGGEGNDELYGGGGADVLDGGSGNDFLQGDHGNDTYIFGKGYDVDTIAASSDLHKIIIHDYHISDMKNTRESNNDLVIDFGNDTGDVLVVKAFFDYNSNRDYNFIFDDGTVIDQYDITAKSAPINGTDGNDYLFGTDGNDVFDGGAGDDSLNGSNGEDTYIFGKGYAHDTINEWGSDHSIVELKDIASDEVTISAQWGSNLLIAVNDTEDVLTISNFKWGQASYTFKFADGAEGYVDKDTWQLILTKQPDPVEEDIEQTNAELLNEIYSDDEFGADIFENDSTIISEVTDSITVSDDTDEVSDMTDIQTMILAENMSAFSDYSNVYDNATITDITADTTALDQLLVSSSVQ